MATSKKSGKAKVAKPVVKKAAPSKVASAKKASANDKSAKPVTKTKATLPKEKAAPAKRKPEKLEVKAKPASLKAKSGAESKLTKVPAKTIEEKVKKGSTKTVEKVVETPKKAEKKEVIKPVKLPKITAQGVVPYEPDFTHSVLDSPKGNGPVTTPTQRYSDSDLAEFRELISRKLESARKELAYLQGLITRKDDAGGEGEDGRYMTMEDGTLSMEREQLSQMASRQIQFIDHLEKAMIRIENKTYGICRETGKLIDKARLRAVPHATLSVEAKMRKSR